MADEVKYDHHETKIEEPCDTPVESSDRGLFDCVGKKEEEKKHEGLFEKLHRTSSSSSSSSDEEECDEHGEKKKKKSLKDKVKEKISEKKEEKKEKEEEAKYEEVIEKCEEPEENKLGLLEKIKDKLPGGKKEEEEEKCAAPPPPVLHEYTAPRPIVVECGPSETEEKEKKGFLEKIKEKFKSGDEKEKEASC